MPNFDLGPKGQETWEAGLLARLAQSPHETWKGLCEALHEAWSAMVDADGARKPPRLQTLQSDVSRLRRPSPESLKRWFGPRSGARLQALEHALKLDSGDLRRLLSEAQMADRDGLGSSTVPKDPLERFVAPRGRRRWEYDRPWTRENPEPGGDYGLMAELWWCVSAVLRDGRPRELEARWEPLFQAGLPEPPEPGKRPGLSRNADLSKGGVMLVHAPHGRGGRTLHAWLSREAEWLAQALEPGTPSPLRVAWTRGDEVPDGQGSEAHSTGGWLVYITRTPNEAADWALASWADVDVARLAERCQQLPTTEPATAAELGVFAKQLRQGEVHLPPGISAREATDLVLAVSQQGAPRSPGAVRERLVLLPLERLARALGRPTIPPALRRELQVAWAKVLVGGIVDAESLTELPTTLVVDRACFDSAIAEVSVAAPPRTDLAKRLRDALPGGRLVPGDRAKLAEAIALVAGELERARGAWLSDGLVLAGLAEVMDDARVSIDARTLLVEGARGLLTARLYPGVEVFEALTPWLADELAFAVCDEAWLEAFTDQAPMGARVDSWLFAARVLAGMGAAETDSVSTEVRRIATLVAGVACHLGWPGHSRAVAGELTRGAARDESSETSLEDLPEPVLGELIAGAGQPSTENLGVDTQLRDLVNAVRERWHGRMTDGSMEPLITVPLQNWHLDVGDTESTVVRPDWEFRHFLEAENFDRHYETVEVERKRLSDRSPMAYPDRFGLSWELLEPKSWNKGRSPRLGPLGSDAWSTALKGLLANRFRQVVAEATPSADAAKDLARVRILEEVPSIATDLFLDEIFASLFGWWRGRAGANPVEQAPDYIRDVEEIVRCTLERALSEPEAQLAWTADLALWWKTALRRYDSAHRVWKSSIRHGPEREQFKQAIRDLDLDVFRMILGELRPDMVAVRPLRQPEGQEAATVAGDNPRDSTSLRELLELRFEDAVLDGASKAIVANSVSLVTNGPDCWCDAFLKFQMVGG